jgi:hypothetical protein
VTASYPAAVKSFSPKVDFADTILAEHVNSLQDEVNSLQVNLGTLIRTGSGWVGEFDQITTDWDTLKDRIENIEYGLNDVWTAVPAGGSTGQVLRKTSSSDYATEWAEPVTGLPSQSGNDGKYLTTDGSTASWATVAQGGETISSFLLAGC